MLKLFPGKREVIGTFVIPASIALALLLLPLLDRVLPAKLAHFLACTFVLTLLGGASFLTVQALRSDANDPLFQAARKKADLARDRAIELAELAGRRYPSRWLFVYPAPRSLDPGPDGAGKEMPRLPLL